MDPALRHRSLLIIDTPQFGKSEDSRNAPTATGSVVSRPLEWLQQTAFGSASLACFVFNMRFGGRVGGNG